MYVDRRFGAEGKGFLLYALGPVFFAGLLVYLIALTSRVVFEGGWGQMSLLMLVGVLVVGVFLVIDCLAVYEARRVVQKSHLEGHLVWIKPLLGRAFEAPLASVKGWKMFRSFGYLPGISAINNSRSNIELLFQDGSSIYLCGSCESDQWIESLSQQMGW